MKNKTGHKPRHPQQSTDLAKKYPPSAPCDCETCRGYCRRPGWWTVAQAARALQAGFGERMMLEVAPDGTFAVLSPAFKGCETNFAMAHFKEYGCTFLDGGRCELHGTGHQPLECIFCHHDRPGLGPKCHADIEKDWKTAEGQMLVIHWANLTGFWVRLSR